MVSCTNMYPLLILLFSCACISDGQPGEHVEPTEMTEHLRVEKFGAAWTHEYKVAFAATLGHVFGPFNEAVTLVYDHVFVNVRRAYNPTTGIFTAPVKGVYFFMVSAFHDSWFMDLRLFKNEQQMVTIYNEPHGRYESAPISASKSISLILEEGDQVYVKLFENAWVYDDENYHNSFVGHLLFPLCC
ncbi:hypothetical protein R3I94_005794 [Phoxinus phoxinus]